MEKAYIDLQSAHITQHTNGQNKTDWEVKANITEENLFTLPKHLNESDVFTIMEFARKYELIAFNAGIAFQKGKQNEVLQSKIIQLSEIVKELSNENERLATVLDNTIARKG